MVTKQIAHSNARNQFVSKGSSSKKCPLFIKFPIFNSIVEKVSKMKFCLFSLLSFLALVQVYSLDNEKLLRIHVTSPKDAELVHEFRLNNVSI